MNKQERAVINFKSRIIINLVEFASGAAVEVIVGSCFVWQTLIVAARVGWWCRRRNRNVFLTLTDVTAELTTLAQKRRCGCGLWGCESVERIPQGLAETKYLTLSLCGGRVEGEFQFSIINLYFRQWLQNRTACMCIFRFVT